MKRFKKLFALALVLVLFAALSLPVYGDTQAQYATTSAFLTRVQGESGYSVAYQGVIGSAALEQVSVTRGLTNRGTTTAQLFFPKTEDEVNFRIWNLIIYDPSDYLMVLETVNQLNCGYRWVKFTVDAEKHAVDVQADVILRGDAVGEVCMEELAHVFSVADLGYRELRQFAA